MKKIIAVLLVSISTIFAQALDINKLIQETQVLDQKSDEFVMIWWIPNEFWEFTFDQDPNVTDELKAEILGTLNKYLVIAVVAADVGPFGGITPKSQDEILASALLQSNGEPISVVADADLSPDARNFVSAMKPMMANMLGQFGEGIQFLMYPNTENEIKATGDDLLTFSVAGKEAKWQLPLPSLLAPMVDAETGEEFPGNYRFNPYTGGALIAK